MSTLRLSGLASGMDTESMIKQLMAAEQLKVDKVEREKVGLEWKKEVWQDFNTKLMSFYNKELFNTKLTSTFRQKNASSSNTIIKASAAAGAPVGTHRFKVNQMAKGVSLMSNKLVRTDGQPVSYATKLSELNPPITSTFKFETDGATTEIEITPDTKVADFLSAINGSTGSGGLSANLDTQNGRIFLSSSKTGEDAKLSITSSDAEANKLFNDILGFTNEISSKSLGSDTTNTSVVKDVFNLGVTGTVTMEMTIGMTTHNIDVNASGSIDDLMTEIRNKFGLSSTDVTFDTTSKQIKFDSGVAKPISMTAPTATPSLDQMKLKTGLNFGYNFQGVNAKVEYEGQAMDFDSNSISINGINIELQGQSTDEIFVTVTDNAEKTVENIKSFVKAYNELLDTGNKLLYAKPVKGYDPLTKEEAKALDEDTKKDWEKTVKSDLLRGDTKLSGLVRSLRNHVGSAEIYKELTKMGIKTGLYTDKGKLIIDEDKLLKAVKKDPEQVQKTFNKLGEDLYEDVKKRIASTKLSGALTLYDNKQIDENIKNYKEDMSDLTRRLAAVEKRYYKQFSVMESMLQKMNSQSASFASMFGGN